MLRRISIYTIVTLLFLVSLVSGLQSYDDFQVMNANTYRTDNEIVIGEKTFLKDSNGNWDYAVDVIELTFNEYDHSFTASWRDKSFTYEYGFMYAGEYYSMDTLVTSYPTILDNMEYVKHDKYWKYGLNITNIPEAIQPGVEYFVIKPKEFVGFTEDDIEIYGNNLVIDDVWFSFDDLAIDYEVSVSEVDYSIYAANVSNRSSLWLDPIIT